MGTGLLDMPVGPGLQSIPIPGLSNLSSGS